MKDLCVKNWLAAAVTLVFALCSHTALAQEVDTDGSVGLVGRIAHIEGQLLRYVPDEDDWVLTDADTPFGQYDSLFSSEDGKAEIIMPNNTMVRIGGDTQVQLIELTGDAAEIQVSSGIARLYNKSSSAEIRAAMPFGEALIPPGAVCDLVVRETQAEIASVTGSCEVSRADTGTRHEVNAGSACIITTDTIVASANNVPREWDRWNADRDDRQTRRLQARGDSGKYLPDTLQDHAAELDDNGRWERVYYEGDYRYVWRPVYVGAGWTPFSAGRWIIWHGEQTWVPCEPFGYVTHHYGNWIYAGSCWYWAPPVSGVMISAGLPLLNVGFNWYPGRVAWVSSGFSIGWFPLAPFEMYYCHGYWGPWSRVSHYNHHYDCHKHRHYRHARFIDHHRFYGSKDYRHAGLRGLRRDEKFRGTAFIPDRIRKDYKNNNRHQFASTMPGFREKVKKIDARRDKRDTRFAGNGLGANPFKREFVKRADGNQRPETGANKTLTKNMNTAARLRSSLETAGRNVPNPRLENRQRTLRSAAVPTQTGKQGDRTVPRSLQRSGSTAEKRTLRPAQVKKPDAFMPGTTAYSRRTLQFSPAPRVSSPRATGTPRQPVSNGSHAVTGNASAGNSAHAFSARSSGSGMSGSDYARPGASVSPGRSYSGTSGSARSGYGNQRMQGGGGISRGSGAYGGR